MHRCPKVWLPRVWVTRVGLAMLITSNALAAETFAPEPASGPPIINASYPIDGQPAARIGKLAVAGAGRVIFFATREQNRLLLKAVGADGSQIGRAESVVGIGDTPIYVRSAKGLYKILVHWKS